LAGLRAILRACDLKNGSFPSLARSVNRVVQEPRAADRYKKRDHEMFGSSVKRTIIAISAALTLSALTVGATVSPAQAGALQIAQVAHG
jgi:hypothetical protein